MSQIPEDLRLRIAEILVDRLFLDVDPGQIDPQESLTQNYGVDSVRLFDFVVGLEEDFAVSFEDEELTLENFDSLARIVARTQAKLEAQG